MADTEKKENKKWGKEAFMTAFYAESNKNHKTWASFHKAMDAASKKAGAGKLEELRLAMRAGSINAQLRKGGMAEWKFPARPKKEAAKPPSVIELAKKIAGK